MGPGSTRSCRVIVRIMAIIDLYPYFVSSHNCPYGTQDSEANLIFCWRRVFCGSIFAMLL